MTYKVYIRTFGCQMNTYDSDKMRDILAQTNYTKLAQSPEEADLIIFNTCSVREKAQEKVFHDLGRVKNLKKNNANLLIGVGGCVASQEGDSILKRAPFVDLVFGPQTLHRLPQLIEKRLQSGKAVVDVSFPEEEKFDSLLPPSVAKVEAASAYVSIMEGCSKFCTYCIVPYTRGDEISRDGDAILKEIHQLTKLGIKEVNLLGQNVNAYRGQLQGEEIDLAGLIEIIAQIPEIVRIRYTTSHPCEVTERLISTYAKVDKLVSHLHLPVQSGSDYILALMKRGYTVLEYKSIIRKLQQIRPDISISSDFIVGFPGESESDFNKTMNLIDEIAFDASFSFIFSPRPGTPAAEMSDTTPLNIKQQRLAALQTKLEKLANKYAHDMVGTEQMVLVEGIAKKGEGELSGRTANNRIVNFPGHERLLKQFVKIKITNALPHSLRGEVV